MNNEYADFKLKFLIKIKYLNELTLIRNKNKFIFIYSIYSIYSFHRDHQQKINK
jgi:hypothetical protein